MYFLEKINNALVLVKSKFQEFVEQELLNAKNERRELLLVVKSELQSLVWQLRMLKMMEGEYQVFNEFKSKVIFENYFNEEKNLIKYFVHTDDRRLIFKIIEGLKSIFENTNSAKYANVDKWFEMFARNLSEEFLNYPYISWERVLIDLQNEKPLEFPSLNEILRRIEKMNIPTREVKFLTELKLINL